VAGLNRLAQGGVDVVLLDLGLPASNGLETFTKMKARASGIPIIILSAAGSELLALQMIQEGAADYLVKSACGAAALVRAVKYAVVGHRWHVADAIGGQIFCTQNDRSDWGQGRSRSCYRRVHSGGGTPPANRHKVLRRTWMSMRAWWR
jgi:DNA-binding NarL/FixJ family response regulator